MKKLIILALLFMGCDNTPTEQLNYGLCFVASADVTDERYACWDDFTESNCNGGWIENMTCEDYCASLECVIDGTCDCETFVD